MAKKMGATDKGLAEDDFLNSVESGTFEEYSIKLGEYAVALRGAEDDVAVAEAILKQKQEVYRKLSEEVLPDIMQAANISELKLGDTGQIMMLKEDLKARIPVDLMKRAECFDWLRAHEAADIIKSEILIPESEDQKLSRDVLDKIKGLGLFCSLEETVNTQSLQALFRDLFGMKKGSMIRMTPEEVPAAFGVYRYRKVTLKG